MKAYKLQLEGPGAAPDRPRKLHHHPFVIPVITFIVLFLITAVALVYSHSVTLEPSDTHTVILSHDKQQQSLPTRAATVGEFLQRIKLQLHEGDVVEPELKTPILEDNFRVNVYRALPVLVVDNDKKTLVYSAASTPRSIAGQAGITVYPEDNIETQPVEDFIKDGALGSKVVIARAVPVHFNLYGKQIELRSHKKTVKDLLAEKNVKLEKDDSVQPALDTPIKPDLQVFVVRQGTQVVTVEEAIPPETKIVQDGSLSFGTTAVRQAGVPGKKLVTYQVQLTNGQETGRTKIQEIIAQAAVEQIVARGQAVSIPSDKTTIMSAAGVAAGDYPYVNYIISHESGWCPTKWQGQVGYCPEYYQQLHDPSSGFGYGLCQSTPAIKMSSAGSDWQTNPVTQLRWCSGYAAGRYGSWGAAYEHWLAYGNW